MDDIVRAFLENEQKLQLVRRLGMGGFAEVWEVEALSGVRSAVKVSHQQICADNPALKKELENLTLVKGLAGHPHVVSLLDYWVVNDYLVTRWELATDGDLLRLWERYRQEGQPGIPVEQLIRLIYDAAEGLDFLHGKGIYHRDIKPQNLLLFHGRVKVGDLGLAKLVGASTASHTGSGTFGYLPPEAWEEHRLTPVTDLYSLAATYVKLRTGKEPFGEKPGEIVDRQRQGEPILDGLEEWEKPLVLTALDPDPRKRPSEGARKWVQRLHEAWLSGSRQPRVQPSASAKPPPRISVQSAGSEQGWSNFGGIISPGTFVIIQPGYCGFSPDGRLIVTTWLTRAIVWDAETGQRLRELRAQHTGGVWSAAISPDGRRIVTTSDDKTAIVWDAETGESLRVFQGHTGPVRSAAFSSDGRRILTASKDKTAIVWDAETGQRRRVLAGHADAVWSAAFSPDGRWIVTASSDKTAIVWDAKTGQRRRVLQGHAGPVYSAAFSSDGRRIVTASDDKTAIVWDAETGEGLRVLKEHTALVNFAAFSPDGRWIVTTSRDITAIVWDAETGKSLRVLRGHTDSVWSAAFSPDGRWIVTLSGDKTAIVWDAVTGEMLLELPLHKGAQAAVESGGSDGVTQKAAGEVQEFVWVCIMLTLGILMFLFGSCVFRGC